MAVAPDTAVIVIAFLAFWGALYAIGKYGKLDQKGFNIRPFYLVYKTARVDGILGRLAESKTLWKVFANFSVGLGVILMIAAMGFLANNLYSYFFVKQSFSEVTVLVPFVTIRNTEVLLYFFLSLPIILVVHEGGHGVIAKLEQIKVKSGGFAIIAALFAGFVEPDEEEFGKAKPISRLRVLGAGSGANVVFSVFVAALLLTTPTFAFVLPEQVRPALYGDLVGVPIFDVSTGSGAEKAGLLPNDIITSVKGVDIRSPADFNKVPLLVGETIDVNVQRNGQPQTFTVTTTPSPTNASRGAIGIRHSGQPYYPPKLSLGAQMPREVSAFLFWLWFLSFNIGIFNMLPFYPLDGDGFFNSMLGTKMPENRRKMIRRTINTLALGLLLANILGTFLRSGFITI
jgi:membrane-associated protease RseP (regulator of RpoE activity)